MKSYFPNIRVRIFEPGNKRSVRRLFPAPPGKLWNEQGIDAQLMHTAGQIEKVHPGQDYRMVRVGPAEFNFVHAGERT